MQISLLVSFMLRHVEFEEHDIFEEPILRFRVTLPPAEKAFLKALSGVVYETVITNPRVQHLEFKGQRMVVDVFDVFRHEPKRFLPEIYFKKYKEQSEDPRVICDYIAGMTDDYLLRLYERLFSPRAGSVFDYL